MSSLPEGSGPKQAAAAVRALGEPYESVKAVDSGLVSVLTQHERPNEEGDRVTSNSGVQGRDDDEERAYEGLLLGVEVSGHNRTV